METAAKKTAAAKGSRVWFLGAPVHPIDEEFPMNPPTQPGARGATNMAGHGCECSLPKDTMREERKKDERNERVSDDRGAGTNDGLDALLEKISSIPGTVPLNPSTAVRGRGPLR